MSPADRELSTPGSRCEDHTRCRESALIGLDPSNLTSFCPQPGQHTATLHASSESSQALNEALYSRVSVGLALIGQELAFTNRTRSEYRRNGLQ